MRFLMDIHANIHNPVNNASHHTGGNIPGLDSPKEKSASGGSCEKSW